MVGHVAVTAIDPDRAASYSKRVIDGLIRKEWGYQGLVITDDLVMGPIYEHGVCTAVTEALNAGADLLLVAYDGQQFYRVFDCALNASADGRLDRAMLQASLNPAERECAVGATSRFAGRSPQPLIPCIRRLGRGGFFRLGVALR
jgi:beta-N-acetylhexosaminidase